MVYQKGARIRYVMSSDNEGGNDEATIREQCGLDDEYLDSAIRVDFLQLEDIRYNQMQNWILGSEHHLGNLRTQTAFDENGNYVEFQIWKSMGQRYYPGIAEFVSIDREGLEELVTGFGLPFEEDKVICEVEEVYQ
jgi:hypothetical protein